MKKYISPVAKTINLSTEAPLLTNSDGSGLDNGDNLGRSFNKDDASYSRRRIIWDDEL